MRFKYKYEHLSCDCCADLEGKSRCPHLHCPHILDNLDDLRHDRAFRQAVNNANKCGTFHRPALLLVRRWGLTWPV